MTKTDEFRIVILDRKSNYTLGNMVFLGIRHVFISQERGEESGRLLSARVHILGTCEGGPNNTSAKVGEPHLSSIKQVKNADALMAQLSMR